MKAEAIYTRRPRIVRALRWTGDNAAIVENFVGSPRCAAWHLGRGVMYLFTVDGITRVLRGDWLYIDERRELHALSAVRFEEEFTAGGVWPVPYAPVDEVMHHPV